jgi:hypothetical protein
VEWSAAFIKDTTSEKKVGKANIIFDQLMKTDPSNMDLLKKLKKQVVDDLGNRGNRKKLMPSCLNAKVSDYMTQFIKTIIQFFRTNPILS